MTEARTVNLQVEEAEHKSALEIQQDVDRGVDHLNGRQYDAAIAAFRVAFERSPENSQFRDIISHNLLTAYLGRIEELLAANEPIHVNRYLPEVSTLRLTSDLRQDPAFRGAFADLMRNLALAFYNHRQHEPALFFIRRALAYEKCPSYYVDLTNTLAWTKQRARLADYTTAYKEAELGRHIFLACAPKSGSTFLKNVLQSITGFKNMFSLYAALQNEQEMDLPHLVKFGNVDTVTQQHARASEANIQMMQAFGIRPVILVRNIFDTVASLLDFYTNGFVFSTYFDRDDFLSFSDAQKIDLLIEYVIPWYFQFVASWQRAEAGGRLEVMWVTYEEMISNKPAMVARILQFANVTADADTIGEQISVIEGDRDRNRFNKGKAGRGENLLSNDQRRRIADLARHFPSRDFGILGL